MDEWMITLVFPIGERLGGGPNSSPGIYAFFQTEMVSNFPFIIQADFLLDQGKQFSWTRSGLRGFLISLLLHLLMHFSFLVIITVLVSPGPCLSIRLARKN